MFDRFSLAVAQWNSVPAQYFGKAIGQLRLCAFSVFFLQIVGRG
jgi:hypothetical protein